MPVIQLPTWTAILAVAVIPLGLFVARRWLTASIEQSVRVKFEVGLERVRADLKSSEERLKSELRYREAEIHSLRENVFGRRSGRLALVDKRRIEAIERIWVAVIELSRMKQAAMSLSMLKVEALEKRVPTDSKLRQVIEVMTGSGYEEKLKEIKADAERPFVSDLAWALYRAYSLVIFGAYIQMKVLSLGLEDSSKLMNHAYSADILKAVLPHRSEYIDKFGSTSHFHLLDELETKILAELRNGLDNLEDDQESVAKAAVIMQQIESVTKRSQTLPAELMAQQA